MSVDQINKIDFVSTTEDGKVVLTISDHLNWKNEKEHIYFLQEKINSYISFIEGGQLLNEYPQAKNRNVEIKVFHQFYYPAICKAFYKDVGVVLNGIDVVLKTEILNTENLN